VEYLLSKFLLFYSYAQSSKRVNVKKLKSDLWTKLEPTCSGENNENISADFNKTSPALVPKPLSFQNIVSDIAQDQTQKDASLSFYFICLLHLANEKVTFHKLVYILKY
jgi:condensin complex subunit 2